MANSDKPMGFRPGYTKHGGPPQLNRYYTDGTANIYIGDLLVLSTGNVKTMTATTSIPMGVSATFTDSTAITTEVMVYDDLHNTIFIAQADGADISATSLCNTGYDPLLTAGSTVSGLSAHEIDSSASCLEYVHVIDKVGRPDNGWGEFVDLYCEIRTDARAHSTAFIQAS